jgi:hypothetical protein
VENLSENLNRQPVICNKSVILPWAADGDAGVKQSEGEFGIFGGGEGGGEVDAF